MLFSLFYAISHPDKVEALLFIAGVGVQNNREWINEYFENREKCDELMPEMEYPFSKGVNNAVNISFRTYIQKPYLFRDISRLKIPSLFLCAGKDIHPSWPVQQIKELINNSILITIPDATHYIWLTHYKEMKSELRKFLSLDS